MSTCVAHCRERLTHQQRVEQHIKTLTKWLLTGTLLILINNILSPFIDNFETFPQQTWSGFLIVIETYIIILGAIIHEKKMQPQNKKPIRQSN